MALFLCIPILLLAVVPAWGDPGRAVYVNGTNYRIYISGGYIYADKGAPDYPHDPYFQTSGTIPSGYKVCRTYNKVPGESLAIFNEQIFYAYTADTPGNAADTTSCSNPGQGKMSVWVAIFNPVTEKWVSNRAIGEVAIRYQTFSASGAAITVFNNQLYLFTDKGIYTSANGTAWAGPYLDASNNPITFQSSAWEPLDAVTIYPPVSDPPNPALYTSPRILIVYGLQTSSVNNYFTSLWVATWNGVFGTGQDFYSIGAPPNGLPTMGSVSLLAGTARDSDWSPREAAAQLFMRVNSSSVYKIQHYQITYGTSRGTWAMYTGETYGTNIQNLFVYFNSQQECSYSWTPQMWDLRQRLFIDWKEGSTRKYLVWASDALSPQNRDIPILNCGENGGTQTDTTVGDTSTLAILQNYWTLVGVILGSPPFGQNGYSASSDFGNFSNVNYGTDQSNSVAQTQSMSNAVMVSAGTEVHAGLGPVGVGVNIDMTYKHAWESGNGTTVTKDLKVQRYLGTQVSSCNEMGRWGWALFMAPQMIYQDWKAYAWDYDPMRGTGSSLNQDLHTIKIKEVPDEPAASFTPKVISFELANPGGPNDEYPGLMSGMQPFNSSLNTNFWYNPGYTWDDDPRWDTKLGRGALPELQFSPSAGTDLSFSENTQSYTSEGQTNDISYTEGVSISAGSKINGMSAYLKVGYEGSFKQNTTTTTGFGTQVTFSLKMKSCEYDAAYCVKDLAVQPYWLQAKDGAPWVPTIFKNQKPWAITWKVTGGHPFPLPATTSSTGCPAPPPATTSALLLSSVDNGGRAGTSLPPLNALGRIVGGTGGGEGGGPYSQYSIQGGRLFWVENGTEERVPMTANDFDPSKGVTVEIQELSWSLSNANGTWTRSGQIWTFAPKNRENSISMQIDFGAATYDLHIQKADLSERVPAGLKNIRLIVTVNQQYAFYTTLQHDIDVMWRWSQPPADANNLHVTSFQGRYNSATRSGKMSIAGTLPSNLQAFGDLEVNLNDHPYLAQLVSLEEFQRAVQTAGTFRYAKQGLILVFDFGNKTWSATFNNKAFNELFAPRVGTMKTQVLVGGVPWYRAENVVLDYSANLKLHQ